MFWILSIPLFLLAYRLFRYITTPLFRILGVYTYYSPMFFTVPFGPNLREIHLGTPWDFMKQHKVNPGRIFGYLACGMHRLSEAIEQGKISKDIRYRGMIHYFNPETMNKFGFKLRRPNTGELILFSLGYLELCLLTSISRKRLVFVNIKDLWVINFTADELLKHKPKFESLARKLVPELYPIPLVDNLTVSRSA